MDTSDTTYTNCEICSTPFVPDGRRKARCDKEHFRKCLQCKNDFVLKTTDKLTKEFCSKTCSNGSRSRVTLCPVCGNEFSKRSKTCSTTCAGKLRRTTSEARAISKECADCGQLFESSNPSELYCQNQHYGNCEVCENSFESSPGKKRRTCSPLCAGKLVNSEESMLKRKETSREKYGTEYPQQSEEVKAKIAASNLERYGYESALGSPELRKKSRATSLERYGVEWYNQTEEAKEILRTTNLDKYGVPNVFMHPEVQAKSQKTLMENLASGKSRAFPRVSKINRKYAAILERELGVEVEFEAPVGSFFVDLKVVHGSRAFYIDIHPTVSHNSEIPFACLISGCESDCIKHQATKSSYHASRAKAALDENKTLIQWYGWQTPEQLVALLRPKLQPAVKISARKATAMSVSSKDANSFLKLYHIQGSTRSQSFRYGLYLGSELIAIATFGKSRFGSKFEHEFIRYAVKPGFVVYGGAGKLVSMFLEDSNSTSLVSYVDFDHTTAQSIFLLQAGFSEIATTGPGLIWHNPMDNRIVKGTSLLMQGADRLLGTSYGSREESGLDNRGIMLAEGFLPVNTSGNRVFLLKR